MTVKWLATVPLLIVLGACGQASPPGGGGPASATPAATIATSAPAMPTTSPTPQPPLLPLAIVRGESGLRAVDEHGVAQWSLSRAALTALVATASTQDVVVNTAGPNVFVAHDAGTLSEGPRGGKVALVDRSGKVVGLGSFTGPTGAGDLAAGPDGTHWAWSVDHDRNDSGAAHHGDVMVAGLGLPPRVAYSWVSPAGCTERVSAWTDMGIVLERFCSGGCGVGFHGDSASFLVDPSAGTITELFSAGQHYLEARHSVRVALAAESASRVLVNGTTFDEPGTILDGGFVSPDGARVALARLTPLPCGGGEALTYKLATEVIAVATGVHSDLPGCEIRGWFDTTHFVGVTTLGGTLTVCDLKGAAGASLGSGTLIGVIAGG